MAEMLVVDLAGLLDRSKVGAAAAAQLEKQWQASADKPAPEREALLRTLQERRDKLRAALLDRARPLLEAMRTERKAKWVLERSAVLAGPTEDVTDALIQKVDAGGPLPLS